MQINEVMHKGTEWVHPDISLVELAKKMRDNDIGALPVGEEDKLVGMVTDRDIVIRCVAEGKDVSSASARDVMTGETIWCYDDADVKEASKLMSEKRVRRIPIINQDKRLVGMLSVGDLTKASTEIAGEALKDLSAAGD